MQAVIPLNAHSRKTGTTKDEKPVLKTLKAGTSHIYPLISVIIPTYNRASMVAEAIESVLNQRFDTFELIVVDDGSTDETQKVLAGYNAAITVIRQANKGVSAARNKGIHAARGNLIAFLDSDDLWQPGKLACQFEFFQNHPETLICQTEEIWIRNGKRVNPKKRHRKPSGDIFIPSLELCLVSPSAVMMRKTLFKKVGLFDENLPACEDYDLWLRVACQYPVTLIDKPLVIKRGGHSDQLSKMESLDRYRIQALLKLLQHEALTESQAAKTQAMLYQKGVIYANGCRKRGKLQEAADYDALVQEHSTTTPT